MKSLVSELGYGRSGPKLDSRGRVKVKNRLGQYLIDASRLYEGMGAYYDK